MKRHRRSRPAGFLHKLDATDIFLSAESFMAWFQSHSLWVQEFTEGLAVLQFDPPGKSVRMTAELQEELDAALVAIEAQPRFRAVLIRSRKPGRFVQGPDVAAWKALKSSGNLGAWCERGQQVWNRLRGLKIPTV